jgi:hypothetical protein
MKLIFTFPPPRLRRAIIPLKNPKNLSEQTGPPQSCPDTKLLCAMERMSFSAACGRGRAGIPDPEKGAYGKTVWVMV